MRKRDKDKQIEAEIDELAQLVPGQADEIPKKAHKKKIPDRRYLIVGSQAGSTEREIWGSVSTGETCAVNQFVKAVPKFSIWTVMFECHVDPEKYKDNPVYKIDL